MFGQLSFFRIRRPAAGDKGLRSRNPRSNGKSPATWKEVPLSTIPCVPGMTLDDELKYFYWCCAKSHRLGNRVVELGPYVGRSTVALAAGVRESADPSGKVVSIDRFQWDPWMLANTFPYTIDGLSELQRARLTPAQRQPKEYDSYRPLFDVFTEPLKDSIEAIDTELETFQWSGKPIDVLMIDAAKSWAALDQIVRQFFPCLTDGAVVIHQDYKHAATYWLHPVTERMLQGGILTVAENVHGTTCQGFRFHKTANFRADDYVRRAFSNADADRLMARSVERYRGDSHYLAVVGARCQLLKDQGQIARAKWLFEEAVREGDFADNHPLGDLLGVGHQWARLLTTTLLESAVPGIGNGNPQSDISATGLRSVSIPVEPAGHPFTVDVPSLDTAGGTALAFNFWYDTCADEAVRIRVRASDGATGPLFYDEQYRILPGSHQTCVVPLSGRRRVALQWSTSTEKPAMISREVHCIAPMLLLDAA
jgi:predicted O-methyltransferase YrrM